jgi:HNH endonuclease
MSVLESKTCALCGNPFYRRAGQVPSKWAKKRFCDNRCSNRFKKRNRPLIPVKDRFWDKVDRRSDMECWRWLASFSTDGYGQISETLNSEERRSLSAHRVSFTLCKGDIPDDMEIMHSCDHKWCVNPNHLSLGTRAENAREASERGLYNPHNRGARMVKSVFAEG